MANEKQERKALERPAAASVYGKNEEIVGEYASRPAKEIDSPANYD